MNTMLLWIVFFGHTTLSLCEDTATNAVTLTSATTVTPLSPPLVTASSITPCTCGVFLSGQFTKGSANPPRGNAALLHELMVPFPCTPMGLKQCTNRCLDTMVKHLPNSPPILCGAIDRDCHKERAYLFVKNCNDKWVNTNLSAGREYCCKDGLPYKCPILS